jgi:Ca2+:H+ antiporter
VVSAIADLFAAAVGASSPVARRYAALQATARVGAAARRGSTLAMSSQLSRGQITLIAVAMLGTAGAGVAHYSGAPEVLAFVVAGIALAALASVVSFATEEVGARFGPAVTGFLQSTLGNLPEFFIVIFALSAGEVVVAQTSLIGSLFANALLVLGLVIIVGARQDREGLMKFRRRLPNDTATLLFSASFVIAVVALAAGGGAPA